MERAANNVRSEVLAAYAVSTVQVVAGDERQSTTEDELVALARAAQPSDAASARSAAAEFMRALERRHQFAVVEAHVRREIEEIFERWLLALSDAARGQGAELTARVRAAVDEQHAELRRALSSLRLGPPVVCAEYSPELQLSMLGLTGVELLEPVLDLGCGQQARLVEYLRARGTEATGVEGHGSGAHVIACDWLDFEPAAQSLGTIVSHQAFSLHFLHHHLAPGDMAFRYAQKYRVLLQALRPGGKLVYAPGLPFIEAHLQGFRCHRVALPEPVRSAVRTAYRSTLGADVAYAAHVTQVR